MGNWNGIKLPSGVKIQAGRTVVWARFHTADGYRHTIWQAELAEYLDKGVLLPGKKVFDAVEGIIMEVGNKVRRAKEAVAKEIAGTGPAFSFTYDFPAYRPTGAASASVPAGEKTIGAILDTYEARHLGFHPVTGVWDINKAGVIERSANKYRQHIRNHIRPYWGKQPCSALTATTIATWLSAIRTGDERAAFGREGAKIIGRSTVEQILTPFKGAVSLAWESFPHGNPLQNFKLDAVYPARTLSGADVDQEDSDVDAFSAEETRKILAAAAAMDAAKGSNWVSTIEFVLLYGTRIGELFGLKADKVDLAKDTFYIHRQCVEGELTARLKTTSSRRALPLPKGSQARTIIAAQLEQALAVGRRDVDGVPFVFGNVFSGAAMLDPVKALASPWKTLLKHAGVRYRSFYNLRHTFATQAYATGRLKLETISRMLGHKNIGITQTVYVQFAKDDTTEHGYIIEGIADAFSRAA